MNKPVLELPNGIPLELKSLAESREGFPWDEFLKDISEDKSAVECVTRLLDRVAIYKDWKEVHATLAGTNVDRAIPKRFVGKSIPSPPLEVDWEEIERQIWVDNFHASIKD